MSVGVIVVSYRTGGALHDGLPSWLNASGVTEIVAIDNGNEPSEAAALDAAARSDRRLRIVRGQGNVGFAAACNMGARHCEAAILVFVNPDVVLAEDAIVRLRAALEAAPPHAIVGGDLRDGGGAPERGSRRDRLTPWRAFVAVSGLSRFAGFAPVFRDFNRHGDPLPRHPVPVGAISGALFAVAREDFEALGGFDEGYFLHVEDIDLCRRAEMRGWPVLFAPGPHGVHKRSTSDVGSAFIRRHKMHSFARYFEKFAGNPFEKALAGIAHGVVSVLWR
ncbi:MAG: glycosyltransferase family 2 protein [Hyphomonadaceae bacterium]|nr:glycosyltransferase family 2 protein [Hyphomonadaceae bacterium]